jgi:hypothetical protein
MNTTTEQQTPHNPEADLALIRTMMAAGRKRAGIDGMHLVWWGALLAATFFYQYATIVGWVPSFGMVLWLTMTIVGWAGSIYLGTKAARSCREHNPALAAYAAAWMAVGITMALYIATSYLGHGGGPSSGTILSSGAIGCAFFVMANVLQIRPMYIPAAGWWLIMSYALIVPQLPKEILLLLSAASLLFIFVPGLYLRRLAATDEA